MKNLSTVDTMPPKKDECLKTAVMQKLRWSEFEYCEFQYGQGLVYLDTYLEGLGEANPAIKATLSNSRIFWNWWKNQWSLRDRCFLSSASVSLNQYRDIYKCIHDGRVLASDVYPNRSVLEESYAEMIHKVVKEEVK